jgi:hypothetical protein
MMVFVSDGVFGPQTDSDVDLGTTSTRFKDAYIDTITTTGDVTIGDDLSVSDDISYSGRAINSTITSENDGSFNLALCNDFFCTTTGNTTISFTNEAAGQSGNIRFINGGNHTISAGAEVAIAPATLTAISSTGTYHLSYFCTAASGSNIVLISASAALT